MTTQENAYQVTCRKVQHIHTLAEKAFRDHSIIPVLNHKLHRHFICSNCGSSIYRFHVVTFPGYLLVCGDIGEMLWRRCEDMFGWAPGAINSINYFEEKVQGMETQEFNPDVARARLMELFEDENLHGAAGIDLTDRVRNCLRYLDDGEHFFTSEVYSEGLFDSGDFPSFTTFNSTFLWCREALLWFFGKTGLLPTPEQ